MNEQNQDPVQQELAAQLEQTEAASAAAGPAPAIEPTPAAPEPGPRHTHPTSLFSIQSFFTVVVLSIFVITFIVQAFQVPSGSMENTLLIGDFLLVDKLHFAGEAGNKSLLPYGTVQRGDIVVFYFPVDSSQFLVKRVIGLPGDHIRLRDKAVYVNGQRLQENYAIHGQRAADGYRDNFPAQRGNERDI